MRPKVVESRELGELSEFFFIISFGDDWKADEHTGVDCSVLVKLPHSNIARSYTSTNFNLQKTGGGDKKVNKERRVKA